MTSTKINKFLPQVVEMAHY